MWPADLFIFNLTWVLVACKVHVDKISCNYIINEAKQKDNRYGFHKLIKFLMHKA